MGLGYTVDIGGREYTTCLICCNGEMMGRMMETTKNYSNDISTTELDTRLFVFGEKQWIEFYAALDKPAQFKPKLHKLLTEPSAFEK